MHSKELLELIPQIEATRVDDGLGIDEREFVWLYEPDRPLRLLKEIPSLSLLFAGGKKNAASYEKPVDTNAIAIVHNHPNNRICPSVEDIENFLGHITHNPKLSYSVIAGTKGGKVAGFYTVTYLGERNRASYLKNVVTQTYQRYCDLRQEEIQKDPSRLVAMWGSSIFTLDEQIKHSLEMLTVGGINGESLILPGYRLENWEILKS